MQMDLSWLKKQLAARNMTQREAAHIAGMTEQMFTNIIKGRRQLALDEADALRRAFGFALPEDAPVTIAVAGKVSAGDGIELIDDYAKGAGMYQILRPAWLPKSGLVAAVIEGTSAEPFAFNGDVIFWRRDGLVVHPEDLGRPVVAELADGRVMLKRLATSAARGKWSLLSINPTHPNIMDVDLRWAARVLAPLAADEVRYLDA